MVRGVLRAATSLGPERTEKTLRAIFRWLSPILSHNQTASANIALAFPEKGEAERKRILRGCWDNLAKVVAEFLFFDTLAQELEAPPEESRIVLVGTDIDILRDDGKPAVIFSAHLGNWELLSVLAEKRGLKTVLPFRRMRNAQIADELQQRRRTMMGRLVTSVRGSSLEIAAAMERGEHLGIMIDQRLNSGIPVPFFGRPALSNPLAAKLARQFDCPVYGARAIRLSGDRIQLELTPPIALPRDREGRIDVPAATARMTEIVEDWVREHPEQWFWFHDRWRM